MEMELRSDSMWEMLVLVLVQVQVQVQMQVLTGKDGPGWNNEH